MTAEEIIDKINNDSFKNLSDALDFATENGAKILENELERERYMRYATSTSVLKDTEGTIFGINGVDDLYSVTMDYEECDYKTTAFLMDEVQTISYKRKNKTK